MNPNYKRLLSTSSNYSSGYPNPSAKRSASVHKMFGFTSNSESRSLGQRSYVPNRSPSTYLGHQSIRTPVRPIGRTTFYDPNYSLTSETASIERSAVIMCVTEGVGFSKCTLGMAAIDLYGSELELTQFTDNLNYESLLNKCNDLRPSLLILPKTFFTEENRLYQILCEELNDVIIKDMERKYFNESEGEEMIRKLRCDDCFSIEIQLKSKYYCLSACAALLSYLETVENLMFAPNSMKIIVKTALNTMFIDSTTTKLLELIVNLNDPKSPQTLFATINKTKTRSGYRLLRSNILQPSTDVKLIENRLDMIEAIVSSQAVFDGFGAVLTKFSGIEVERVISCLVQRPKQLDPNVKTAERKIECILILKHIISHIGPIVETLSLCDIKVFDEYLQMLNDQRFTYIMVAINEYISEECMYIKGGLKMKLEKCSAIKKGINGLLDMARDAYSESIDDVYHIVSELQNKYQKSLPLKLVYTQSRGYHLEIVCKDDNKNQFRITNEFTKIVFNKKSINFTTQELINKNNRINSAVEEIYLMSDTVISVLMANILEFIGCLYKLAEVIAKLDLIYSLASQCALANYVRPKFSNYLAIEQGIHPVLERVINKRPVPNDIFLTEENNFMVITGPNMSGKSTLLKQVALHQVMAQIGSYVSAEFATFRIFDRLFSRIGNNDEIETNSSTFMVEMREMSYILSNLNDTSLVIIDELGRGTSVEEGVGICFAICEHLLKTKAFTLMATHFIELTKLENFYINVSNFNFGIKHETSEGENDSYVFTHMLEKGATNELFYGLRLAHYTDMEPQILAQAHQFAELLQNIQNPAKISDRLTEKDRIYYKVASLLMILVNESGIPDSETLEAMQIKYQNEIECANQRIDDEIIDLQNDFALI